MGNEKAKTVEWGSDLEFIFTTISLAVGLGNVWRYIILN
jgi:SNF family Na+-dependent transporter